MKTRDLFWGLFFILLGALLLLDNFNVIRIGWTARDIWRFWPVLFVLVGLNLISRHSVLVYKVAIVIMLAAFGYAVVYGYQLQHHL